MVVLLTELRTILRHTKDHLEPAALLGRHFFHQPFFGLCPFELALLSLLVKVVVDPLLEAHLDHVEGGCRILGPGRHVDLRHSLEPPPCLICHEGIELFQE